jgi:asparagine synthase (glutamine-hydrolysing)
MCGILAILSKRTPTNLKQIFSSAKYLAERGPDGSSTLIRSNSVYIFYRLSINDISINGMQPFTSDSVLCMCNGQIYNHQELRKEFNLSCQSNSDCEVILHLYKKIGFVETVKRLYGVFSIILADGENVYITRDRIGVRPLYTGITSEKYIALSSVPNCLVDYCSDVKPFPPGHISVYNKGQDKMSLLYTDIVSIPEIRISENVDLDETVLRVLKNSLIESVKTRLISDRPIACLLSGGLDSSLVTAILSSIRGRGNVRTYSIGMEGSTDLFYAKKVADFLGTVHTEVKFTPEEGFSVIPEVIRALASYDITTIRASVGMYLVSKYISKNSTDKVIFSGEGADEILQGYLYFHNAPTPEEGECESLRLVNQLHMYDVLRADRCISSNGLEARVPFLDRKFVNLCMSLPAALKGPIKGIEKYILRKAFDYDNPEGDRQGCYLPKEVLWRRKEGFSDGTSSIQKPWYKYIAEYVDRIIPDYLYNPNFPSKEAQYYKMIFDNIFPKYNVEIPYWMPKWCGDVKDPSGRLMKAFDQQEPLITEV